MRTVLGRIWWGAALAALGACASLRPAEVALVRGEVQPVVDIGTVADDRLRLAQVLGADSLAGYLLRTRSALMPRAAAIGGRAGVRSLLPHVQTVWNSDVAFSLNDGTLWAGRGANVLARGGIHAWAGPLEVMLAPEITHSRNLPFDILASEAPVGVLPRREPGRSVFSSPWHVGDASADLPLRFGNQSLTIAHLGQSSVTLHAGPAAVGVSSEAQWWGPGVRTALVMSNNAPGVPHLFARTGRPISTRLGDVEARLVAGVLTESVFFDTLPANDLRSLSGAVVTLRPARARSLRLGAARTVVRSATGAGAALAHAGDVIARWDDPVPRGDSAATVGARSSDAILSLFGRWTSAASALELYAEWARTSLPRSLREFLLAPHETQGYTLGMQWAGVRRGESRLRVQLEGSTVEQSIAFAGRVPRDFYAGAATLQGYTQRGQVLGAATGPGSSTQHAALDWIAPRWQTGIFGGRIRWENDALYRQPTANFFRHDVSMLGGVRGAWRAPAYDVSADVTLAHRINYLTQNGFGNPGNFRTVDVHNLTVGFSLSPR